MEKDWNGCREEECNMWARIKKVGCPLEINGKLWCDDTGEFFIPKKVEPVAEYEDIIPFTILDLATIGVPHAQIRDFTASNMGATTSTQFSASRNHEDLESLGMLTALEKHGFFRRKVPDFEFADLVMWESGPGKFWVGAIREFSRQEVKVFCISPEAFGSDMTIDKSRLTKIEIP